MVKHAFVFGPPLSASWPSGGLRFCISLTAVKGRALSLLTLPREPPLFWILDQPLKNSVGKRVFAHDDAPALRHTAPLRSHLRYLNRCLRADVWVIRYQARPHTLQRRT